MLTVTKINVKKENMLSENIAHLVIANFNQIEHSGQYSYNYC
jgi:hypothetical protein